MDNHSNHNHNNRKRLRSESLTDAESVDDDLNSIGSSEISSEPLHKRRRINEVQDDINDSSSPNIPNPTIRPEPTIHTKSNYPDFRYDAATHSELVTIFNAIFTTADRSGKCRWVVNEGNGRFNCLECCESTTLALVFSENYSSRAYEEQDSHQKFQQSSLDPNSYYIECDEAGKLQTKTGLFFKKHFQENHGRSYASQLNQFHEHRNLKGFACAYNSDHDPLHFLLSNDVKYSDHDDILMSWCGVTASLPNGVIFDHIFMIFWIGFYQIVCDPQLNNGTNKTVCFKSISELAKYREKNLGYQEGNRRFREHNFEKYTSNIVYFPLSSSITIKNYRFRRLSQSIWPYSVAKANCDTLFIDYKKKTFPNQTAMEWFGADAKNAYEYIAFIMSNNINNHTFIQSLIYNLSILFDGVYPLNPTSLHSKIIILTIQKCMNEHTIYGSDANIYRWAHNDKDIRAHCIDKVKSDTERFRARCLQTFTTIKHFIPRDRYQRARNLLIINPMLLYIADCNGTKYIITTIFNKDINKKILLELLMIVSNSSGYDIRCHSNDEILDNLVVGGSQLNTLQGVIPMWLLLDSQIKESVISMDDYIDHALNYCMTGSAFKLEEIMDAQYIIAGIPADEIPDIEDEQEASIQLQAQSQNVAQIPSSALGMGNNLGRFADSQESEFGSMALSQLQIGHDAQPLVEFHILPRLNHNPHRSRTYQRPQEIFLYSTRQQELEQNLTASVELITTKMIKESDVGTLYNLFSQLSALRDEILLSYRAPAFHSRVNALINQVNDALSAPIHLQNIQNHIGLNELMQIERIQNYKIPKLQNQTNLLEKISAYISYLLLLVLGHRANSRSSVISDIVSSLTDDAQRSKMKKSLQRNVLFGEIVSKHPKLVLLKFKISAFDTNKRIKSMLNIMENHRELILSSNERPPIPWTSETKQIFASLF